MTNEGLGERLYSANELAQLVGVAATTIRNWTARPQRSLSTVETLSGKTMYRLSDLSSFVSQNPDLRKARAVAELVASRRFRGVYAETVDIRTNTPTYPQATEEAESLRAALRDMRAAVEASVQAVARCAELAENTAAANREVIAALQVTVRAYDAAMATMYSSRTNHD